MLKKSIISGFFILLLFFILSCESTKIHDAKKFVVDDGKYAIITEYGKIISVLHEPGEYSKKSYQEIIYFDKKIKHYTSSDFLVPTLDKIFVKIDLQSNWRITDPELFYIYVNDIGAAERLVSDVTDSAVRNVISSNSILELEIGDDVDKDEIRKGRNELKEEMIALIEIYLSERGLEVVDLIFQKIEFAYPKP